MLIVDYVFQNPNVSLLPSSSNEATISSRNYGQITNEKAAVFVYVYRILEKLPATYLNSNNHDRHYFFTVFFLWLSPWYGVRIITAIEICVIFKKNCFSRVYRLLEQIVNQNWLNWYWLINKKKNNYHKKLSQIFKKKKKKKEEEWKIDSDDSSWILEICINFPRSIKQPNWYLCFYGRKLFFGVAIVW